MLDNKTVILCPEIVPLDNKGEEAIIKGIMDLLDLNPSNCYYQVIDHSVETLTYKNDLILHPTKLFFPKWRTLEFGIGLSFERIYSSVCAVVRHALNRIFPQWVLRRPVVVKKMVKYIKLYKKGKMEDIPERLQEQIRFIANTDYIIAGHNGGLNELVCHVLLALKEVGYSYTIFGSCMRPNVHEKHELALYNKVFEKSDNVICRNPIGYRWVERYFVCDSVLAPDPAFYMEPITEEQTKELISKMELTDFFKKPVIMVTTAEPAPISLRSFDAFATRVAKINAHRIFLGKIIRSIIDNTECNILFLPHTIGPEKYMDDRLISKDAILKAQLNEKESQRCILLEDDLSCRELKGLMRKAHFLIAERVHSVIGAIGVHTPFICLASNKDNRVNGMLIELAGLKDYIYHLNTPSIDEFETFFRKSIAKRDTSIRFLEDLDKNNREHLNIIKRTIHIPS